MAEKMTLAEAKKLLGLPELHHGLNDEGHRVIGSGEAVAHFQAKVLRLQEFIDDAFEAHSNLDLDVERVRKARES
jgi:bisphosphoglycerate-independent phosphoglycerate mutase (AlkP superfamily)